MSAAIARRHEAIRRAVTPLPGSIQHDHFKALNIPGRCDGLTMLAALDRMVGNVSPAEWALEFARGRIVNPDLEPVAPTQIVRAGQRFRHLFPGVTEPWVNGAVEILHEDESLVVVNKPAPLPVHAGGRYYRNTLQHILNEAYHPQTPHPAHRLDAGTTGVVLVARTRAFAAQLHRQFALDHVAKVYLVRVQGWPPEEEFSCDAPISVASGRRCSRTVDMENGQPAQTGFRVRQRQADGTTLIEARPRTGRTNQIRVHLWHLGFPVCGEAIYLPDGNPGRTSPPPPDNPVPLCLHAWQIRFVHPLTQETLEFAAPAPAWCGHMGSRL